MLPDMPGCRWRCPATVEAVSVRLLLTAGLVRPRRSMLGHEDASMTLDIYGHLFPDRLDEVAAALDRNRQRALQNAA